MKAAAIEKNAKLAFDCHFWRHVRSRFIPATWRSPKRQSVVSVWMQFILCPRRGHPTNSARNSPHFRTATRWWRSRAAGHPKFIPSLAEAPPESGVAEAFYSIDTVRRFHREHPRDRIYFILGADSFLEITIWKNFEALLDSCDFIIASRPGFRIDAVRQVLPPKCWEASHAREPNAIALRKSTVHLLTAVSSEVSSTEIRRRRKSGASIHALVPEGVEDYILKQALYR